MFYRNKTPLWAALLILVFLLNFQSAMAEDDDLGPGENWLSSRLTPDAPYRPYDPMPEPAPFDPREPERPAAPPQRDPHPWRPIPDELPPDPPPRDVPLHPIDPMPEPDPRFPHWPAEPPTHEPVPLKPDSLSEPPPQIELIMPKQSSYDGATSVFRIREAARSGWKSSRSHGG